MKRTTILLSDELATLLEVESQRCAESSAEIVRRALSSYFKLDGAVPKQYRIVGLGASGHHDTAENVERILAEEWGRAGRP